MKRRTLLPSAFWVGTCCILYVSCAQSEPTTLNHPTGGAGGDTQGAGGAASSSGNTGRGGGGAADAGTSGSGGGAADAATGGAIGTGGGGTGGARTGGAGGGTAGSGAGGGGAGAGGVAGAGGGAGAGAAAPSWPLAVSSNGRYLVDQKGAPFFIVGDSDWTLVNDLPEASRESFFSTRQSQGFNTVLFELMSHSFYTAAGTSGPATPNVPADPTGQLPFLMGTDGQPYTKAGARAGQHADFSTPNDTFFARAAGIVDQAASHGLTVNLYVMPWGFAADPTAGWWSDIVQAANTQTVCAALGRYLAVGHGTFTGLATRTNIILTHGSDYGQQASTPPSAEGEQRMLQLMNGLIAGGATQIRSGDWEAPSLSTDETVFASSMMINGVYTYGGLWSGSGGNIPGDGSVYQEAFQGWFHTPATPAFLKETFYEHSPLYGGTLGAPKNLRSFHYWAILAGATAGVFYGSESVWPFVSGMWQTALTDPGAADVTRLASLFRGLAWSTLAPTGRTGLTTFVTAGGGSYGGTDYVTAALDPAGHLAIAFMPTARALTVDMTKMAGSVTARWYDPTTGTYSAVSGSPFANTGTHAFTPPTGAHTDGATDWLLLLTN